MKKFYVLLLVTCCVYAVPHWLQAQASDVFLTTQAEVDAYKSDSVSGTLYITGEGITHLDSLYRLKKIGEHFIIQHADNLEDLDGLENLEKVTCSFELKENAMLRQVEALANLQYIGRMLEIRDNPNLESVKGLEQIDSVTVLNVVNNSSLGYCCEFRELVESNGAGEVYIDNNGPYCNKSSLDVCSDPIECPEYVPPSWAQNICYGDLVVDASTDLSSFSCDVITGDLVIRSGNLAKLSSLKEIGGSLIVNVPLGMRAAGFLNLEALNNVKKIGCSLNFSNTLFEDLFGLNGVEEIGKDLIIQNNPDITTLRALRNLQSVRNILITNNTHLESCCMFRSLLESGHVTGTVTISGNDPACTEEAILNCADSPGYCLGDVFITSQQEADMFDCKTITGDLNLWVYGTTSMSQGHVDLSNLDQLKDVYGDVSLRINDKTGTSLAGLDNLKTIGGTLGLIVPLGYFQIMSAEYDLSYFGHLKTVGGIKTEASVINGAFPAIHDPVQRIELGYNSTFTDSLWYATIPSVDSVVMIDVYSFQFSYDDFFSRLTTGGSVSAYIVNTDLSFLQGKEFLRYLDLNFLNGENFDGAEDLQRVDHFEMTGNLAGGGDCCGLYNFLKYGDTPVSFQFDVSPCTVEDILASCGPSGESARITLYPNPVQSNVVKVKWRIKDNETATIQVIDNMGALLHTEKLDLTAGAQQWDLDVSDLPTGTYFFRILTPEGVELRRFVKQ